MGSVILAKSRESNFELLRLLAMFLIVLSHFVVHGVYPYWQQNISTLDHLNNIVALLFCTGEIGVTLFVLLTGYFSCQQNFKLKKWLDIYFKNLFFSVLILVPFFWISPKQASSNIMGSLFPFTHNSYWFITSWLLLYAFSPLLNVILRSSSPNTIRNCLLLGTAFWIMLPIFGLNGGRNYSDLTYFIYLYLLGGVIKLKYITFSKKHLFFVFLAILSFSIAMITTEIWFGFDKIYLSGFSRYSKLNTLYTLSVSLWLFYLFKNLKFNNTIINWLASSVFVVYLLHDNNLVRPWLWHELLNVNISMYSAYFTIWAIIVSLSVFGLCIMIDKLLSFFYNPLINYAENKILKLAQPIKKVFGILSK